MSLVPHADPILCDAMLFKYVKHRDLFDINYLSVFAKAIGDFALNA